MAVSPPQFPFEVLVTDPHRGGLAAARSLARRGIPLLVLESDPHNLVFHSHLVKHVLRCPSSFDEPEAFFQFALDAIRKYRIRLVFPIGDPSQIVFDRFRDLLPPTVKLAMPGHEATRSVLDKRINLAVARRAGVPCPRQFDLTSPEQIPEMVRALGFPVVLKRPGLASDPAVPAFAFRVLYAHNLEELRRYIDQFCRPGMYPLFQEFVDGQIHNLCCFAAKGELVAVHQYRSIRRWEGTGVLREVVEADPDLMKHARNLLGALNWDGPAHLGFFVSPDHKQKWYMETNGRIWASVQGSIYAGWDFPFWVYDYFSHGKIPDPPPIQIGSRTCWHQADLAALIRYLGGGEVAATGTRPGKLQAVFQYLSGFAPNIHSEVFQWRDPLPELMDHWELLGRLWNRARHQPEQIHPRATLSAG
jgi:predicted ATP-grasp superfamily ATP-dependent carboligase